MKYAGLITFILFLQGCTGIDRVMMNSDPSASVRYMKENHLGYDDIGPHHQIRVCEGYLVLKRFTDFEHCLDNYWTKVARPGIMLWGANPWGNTRQWFNEDYGVAYEFGMRAEAALDLGDLKAARQAGEKAYTAVMAYPSYFGSQEYADVYRTWLLPRIGGVLSIVASVEGRTEDAKRYIRDIEALDVDNMMTAMMEPNKKAWLARSYLADNRPVGAYEMLTGSTLSSGSAGITALYYVNYLNPAYYAAKALSGFDLYDATAGLEIEKSAMLCRSLLRMEKLTEAQECYTGLKQSALLASFGNIEFAVLNDLGEIAIRQNDWAAAEAHLAQAITLLETQRSSISLDSHKMGFVGDRLNVYDRIIRALLAQNKAESALAYVERAKSRALVDLLASKKSFSSADNDAPRLIAELDQHTEESYSAITLDNTRNVRGLKKKIQVRAPRLSSVTTVTAYTFEDLKRMVPGSETLVEYFGQGDEWYAFVMHNGHVQALKLPVSNLAEHVRQFRQAILQPGDVSYREHAHTLYQQLIAPLAEHINTTDVVIVPHGTLHYLPFNALHDNAGFLVDRYSIRYLPSISVSDVLNQPEKRASIAMSVFGNPDLGDARLDLPGAELEAIALGKTVAGANVRLRAQATETAVKQLGQNSRILHIASHGEFDARNPLASRLLLAADQENDGFLTVSDLYELDLKAELVTLSACETGLGEVKSGDDVVGLSRGFMYAGASAIVSTLWVVDDTATEKMMVRFYQDLDRLGKRNALRQAQQYVKQSYHEHPFYWAAFQLTGRD